MPLQGTLIHLGVTLGLFAPDPNQGPEDPGPATGEITLLGISTVSACRAGVTEGLKASGPRKPGKSEGESKLSPKDYSLAFPGCDASGLAASPPGQKHNGVKSDFRVPLSISGNQAVLHNQAASAIEVQEMKSPGVGARGPHRPSLRSALKCPFKHRQNSYNFSLFAFTIYVNICKFIKKHPGMNGLLTRLYTGFY